MNAIGKMCILMKFWQCIGIFCVFFYPSDNGGKVEAAGIIRGFGAAVWSASYSDLVKQK